MSYKKIEIHDSTIRYGAKTRQMIRELSEAWFTDCFKMVTVNREEQRFDILLIDADKKKIEQFLEKYPQCNIELVTKA